MPASSVAAVTFMFSGCLLPSVSFPDCLAHLCLPEAPPPAGCSSVFALSPGGRAPLPSATACAHACAESQGQDGEGQYLKRRRAGGGLGTCDFVLGLEMAGAPGHSGAESVLGLVRPLRESRELKCPLHHMPSPAEAATLVRCTPIFPVWLFLCSRLVWHGAMAHIQNIPFLRLVHMDVHNAVDLLSLVCRTPLGNLPLCIPVTLEGQWDCF